MVNASTGPTPLAPALRPDPHFSFWGAPFRDAAVTLQRWATAGYFTPSFNGLDAQDSMDAFFDGRTAIQLISSTQNGQILALSREKKLSVGVFAFPSTRAGHPIMPQSGYAGWAIPRGSAHPALATAFIDQMLSPQTAALLLAHGLLPADTLGRDARTAAAFQQDFLQALETATPGVYLDAAPIPNLNATMEATIQLLLTGHESPDQMLTQLQTTYASGGARTTSTRTDGEF
jgi:raffinose/stachyose/melibiose transport system substrate-binding protein